MGWSSPFSFFWLSTIPWPVPEASVWSMKVLPSSGLMSTASDDIAAFRSLIAVSQSGIHTTWSGSSFFIISCNRAATSENPCTIIVCMALEGTNIRRLDCFGEFTDSSYFARDRSHSSAANFIPKELTFSVPNWHLARLNVNPALYNQVITWCKCSIWYSQVRLKMAMLSKYAAE